MHDAEQSASWTRSLGEYYSYLRIIILFQALGLILLTGINKFKTAYNKKRRPITQYVSAKCKHGGNLVVF